MTFTKEQLKLLSQFEGNFHTAIHADWSRAIGKSGTELLSSIWKDATGDSSPVNSNCSHCVLALIKKVGAAYYRDIEEMEKAEAKVSKMKSRKNGNKENKNQ